MVSRTQGEVYTDVGLYRSAGMNYFVNDDENKTCHAWYQVFFFHLRAHNQRVDYSGTVSNWAGCSL